LKTLEIAGNNFSLHAKLIVLNFQTLQGNLGQKVLPKISTDFRWTTFTR